MRVKGIASKEQRVAETSRVGLGIHVRSAEGLGPIRGEALDMLGMETVVAERMADYFVGHHPTMPGGGKTAQAVDAARCPEDSAHASMMTSVPHPGKTTRTASSTGLRLTLLVERGRLSPTTHSEHN